MQCQWKLVLPWTFKIGYKTKKKYQITTLINFIDIELYEDEFIDFSNPAVDSWGIETEEYLYYKIKIDKFIIYVGQGERNGITQSESILIWEIYKKYLPSKVEIQPSKAPIGDIFRYAKNNPEEIVYFIIGAREGNEDDLQDISQRTTGVEDKYSNLKVKVIQTADAGVSGTKAREASKQSPEAFYQFL